MATIIQRRYRLVVPLAQRLTYRIDASWPKYSASACFCELADDLGHIVRIASTISTNPAIIMESRSAELPIDFAPSTATDLFVNLAVPDDARSDTGFCRYRVLPNVFVDRLFQGHYLLECMVPLPPPPPPPRIPLNYRLNDPIQWLLHARIVQSLYFSPAAAMDVVNTWQPGYSMSGFAPDGTMGSGVLIMFHPDRTFVWCVGTQNNSRATYQTLGYVAGPRPDVPWQYSANAVQLVGAQATLRFMADSRVTLDKPMTIIGHSLGGSIAHILACRFLSSSLFAPDVLTFGCPKTGDDRMKDLEAAYNGINIANDFDPVIGLPPRLIDAGQEVNRLAGRIWKTMGDFEFHRDYVNLSDDGTVRQGAPKPSLFSAIVTQIKALALQQQFVTPANHEISAYIQNLILAIGRYT